MAKEHPISLGQAAVIAGVSMLVVAIVAPFAQFYVFEDLLGSDDASGTVQSLIQRRGFFAVGIFAYFINYVADVVVAWALYILLLPVNRYLSLISVFFCLIYVALAISAVLNYVNVYHLLAASEASLVLGEEGVVSQVYLLLSSYKVNWEFSLLIFGLVLILRGYLVVTASYIPTIFGVLLIIGGFGYIVYVVGFYVYPNIDLSILFVTFLSEPVFMFWLLIKGRRIGVDSKALSH